jgi:hypothetical protein
VLAEKIFTNVENGDVESLRLFCRYSMPRHRFVPEPVDLPVPKDLTEARIQIGRLASLAAEGLLDLDSMTVIARALAIGARLEELEEILAEREGSEPDDVQG